MVPLTPLPAVVAEEEVLEAQAEMVDNMIICIAAAEAAAVVLVDQAEMVEPLVAAAVVLEDQAEMVE